MDPFSPDRTIARAVRALRVVGLFLFVVGLVLSLAANDAIAKNVRLDGPQRAIFSATASSLVLGPGIVYWILSIFLHRRRAWAVPVTELATWFQLFFAGTLLLISLVAVREAWPLTIISSLWTTGLIEILRRIRRCADAIRVLNKQVSSGFEPVGTTHV